jgi:FMN-dependent NADH-azoreductase
MAKTLLVTYLPHGEQSTTKKLVDTFLEQTQGAQLELDRLDLLKQVPPHFQEDSTAAYYKRNLGGQALTSEESATLVAADALAAQFVAADTIILAHPVHNFSVPGIMKLYIDAVAQWGVTNNVGPDGKGFPMSEKRILILTSSMGDYTPGTDGEKIDFAHRYAKHLFGNIMKFKTVEIINAGSMYGSPEEQAEKVKPAIEQVKALVKNWYGQ